MRQTGAQSKWTNYHLSIPPRSKQLHDGVPAGQPACPTGPPYGSSNISGALLYDPVRRGILPLLQFELPRYRLQFSDIERQVPNARSGSAVAGFKE
jgi:hypothetical protein